ncbi:hypothetical protein [Sandarakinorhabdus sp.]|uniref:hypothetical protein n=1 Tax=Sandarakinorhabdus sp. TaxID=1916663 RepID=UPI00286E9DA4|nr:hypothetical protein [Sandarakinorhabdus sp.]
MNTRTYSTWTGGPVWPKWTGGPAIALLVGAILRRDGKALLFGLVACAIAATVATFQFAVFTSFLRAGAAAPRFVGADAWIAARGVECFDFPAPLSEGYAGAVLAALPGARVRPVLAGFGGWAGPGGSAGNVMVIGLEGTNMGPRGFLADASDLARLNLAGPATASIGGITMTMAGTTDRLATFLGAPYVVLPADTARRALGWPPGQIAYLAIDFPGGVPADLDARLAGLAAHYPEISAYTGAGFEARSSLYWQAKTGAGAAILLAAVLAALLDLLLLVNACARFVQRRQADILSLIGHGAGAEHVLALIVAMAGVLVLGSLLAVLLAAPLITMVARPLLPWVTFKSADLVFALGLSLVAFIVAALAARADIQRFPPDAMFRN